MKTLPKGDWFSLSNLDQETTEEELVDAIAAHTGVVLTTDQIDIRPYHNLASAIISFDRVQVRQLFEWAFQGQTVHGVKFQWRVPTRGRAA